MKYLFTFIFSISFGVEAKHGIEFRHLTRNRQNSAESGEQSVLTLDSAYSAVCGIQRKAGFCFVKYIYINVNEAGFLTNFLRQSKRYYMVIIII